MQAAFEGVNYVHRFEVGRPLDLDQGGLTGAWQIPQADGQGLVLELDADFHGSGAALLFAGWFTYAADASGQQQWYTLQGRASSASASAVLPIYLTQGGRFAAADPTTTQAVGAATLQFSDCQHGSLDYVFSDGSGRAGSMPLVRSLPSVTCAPGGDNGAAAFNFLLSGAWTDVGASGQGVLFEINPLRRILFGAWFTYGHDGAATSRQRWLTLRAAFAEDATSLDGIGIYETTGGLFDLPDCADDAAGGCRRDQLLQLQRCAARLCVQRRRECGYERPHRTRAIAGCARRLCAALKPRGIPGASNACRSEAMRWLREKPPVCTGGEAAAGRPCPSRITASRRSLPKAIQRVAIYGIVIAAPLLS